MSREYTFTVADTEYKGTTASAKAQFEAMHIALRTSIMSILDESKEFSEMGVVGFFGGVEYDEVEKIVKLLVTDKVVRREDDVPVGMNLFGDHIEQYYLVVFHALRENLGGFWQLRRPTGAKAAEPTATS